MAVIYLRHPIHGSKVACSDWEAAYDEQHGWEQYDPAAPDDDDSPETSSEAPAPAVEFAVRPKRKYTRRNALQPSSFSEASDGDVHSGRPD